MRLNHNRNLRPCVVTESILSLLVVIAMVAGCHETRSGVQTSLDAMVPISAATPESGTRAEDEHWEHTKRVFNVPVGRAPVLGPEDALVTIVEFSEFSIAPRDAAETMLQALRSKYGNMIRLAWKNKPQAFRIGSEPAAEAALEVRAEGGDPAFWNVHDRFFDNKSELRGGKGPDVDAIVKLASEAGANAGRVRSAIARQTHKEEIGEDLDLAEDLEVETTPYFFVNGRPLDGTQPQERFERMIDEEIHKAAALIARGTRPSDVYETLVKNRPGPWQPESKPLPKSLPTSDPALGTSNATVTVHVWSDYQCAGCSAVERMMSALRKEHRNRIRFVWHDLPLPRHKDAWRMAQAGREAYQQKGTLGFWSMHHKIADHPQVPGRSDLDAFAAKLNLDMTRWSAALDGSAHTTEIDADQKAAAEDGIEETPAFLVRAGKSAQGYFVDATDYASKLGRVVERALDESGAERRGRSE